MSARVLDFCAFRARRQAETQAFEFGTLTCRCCGATATGAQSIGAPRLVECPVCGSDRTTYESFGVAVHPIADAPAARG